MSVFRLEVVTPERKFFEGEVENLIITTPEGEVGILKNHEQAVFAVAPGVIKILANGQWKEAAVSSGFTEVTHEKTIVLVGTAEWPEEIDVNRANTAREKAEEKLRQSTAIIEHLRSQAALARALARLKVTRNK